jgi:hypothetical protein
MVTVQACHVVRVSAEVGIRKSKCVTREEGKDKFEGFVQPAQLKVSKITLVSMQEGLRNLNGWEEFSVRLAACSSALQPGQGGDVDWGLKSGEI